MEDFPFAFPSPATFAPDGEQMAVGEEGMTLHDYFMAHAPAEPQDWFMPVMPPCPIVPSIASVANDGLRRELQDVHDGACDLITYQAAQWVGKREKLVEQQTIWQAEFRKQRCIQWPSAWADAMLEQRKC